METMPAIDSILYLMLRSPIHKNMSLTSFDRVVMPSLYLGQYALWHTPQGIPTGYASWAYLTDEAAQGYVSQTRKLQPDDWAVGDQLWFINLIAPFGGVPQLVRELQGMFIDGTVAFSLRNKNGKRRISRYGCRNPNILSSSLFDWPPVTSGVVH